MMIVAFMKAAREVWLEALKLRQELAKRYPLVLAD